MTETVATARAALRELLKEDIGYNTGEAIRTLLHKLAIQYYEPAHSDTAYMNFIEMNPCDISMCHAQCQNRPYYFTLFTVASQHVNGDCLRECLDEAIRKAAQ
jgi:hypothetical protein